MGNSHTTDRTRLLTTEFQSHTSIRALQLPNHDDESVSYEGHLFITSDNGPMRKWFVLKGHELLIYNDQHNQQQTNDTINLNLYYTVRREGSFCCKHRLTTFRLIANPKRSNLDDDDPPKEYVFRAPTNEEREEWIRCLRTKLPDKVGTSLNWKHQYETYCSYWFMILCVAMAFTFIIGVAFQLATKYKVKLIHAFCIPLSMYQLALIALCTGYCISYDNPLGKIKGLMKFSKFWGQSLLCSLYNLITFLFLLTQLCIKANSKDGLSENYAWFFANLWVYFFGIFSIPLPAICIRLQYKYKLTNIKNESENERGSFYLPLPEQPSVQGSVISSLLQAGHENGANDENEVEQDDQDDECDLVYGIDGVNLWLDKIGMSEYKEKFEGQKLNDMDFIINMELASLKEYFKEMEIPIGDRERILQEIRAQKKIEESEQGSPRMGSFSILSDATSVDRVAASNGIFTDNLIKGVICLCYFIHFLSYMANPLLNHAEYVKMMEIMYPGYDINPSIYDNWSSVIYTTNQVFFRTFVGMSLTSVFFTFVTELTDKKMMTTSYRMLKYMWYDQQKRIWKVLLVFMVILYPFELFAFRDYVTDQFRDIDGFLNDMWIFVNACVTIMNCALYTPILSGIYRKTRRNYLKETHKHKTPTSPIKAFVSESITLLSLYFVYVVFLIIYDNNHETLEQRKWDIYRQGVILCLCFSQFITLIRMKQIHKFPNTTSGYHYSFKSRKETLLNGYFKSNCLLIIYNVGYIFIFKIQYFSSKVFDSAHRYQNLGYAFSFSVSSAMLFILSHFINSYRKFKIDLNLPKNKQSVDYNEQTEQRKNSNLKQENVDAHVLNVTPERNFNKEQRCNTGDSLQVCQSPSGN